MDTKAAISRAVTGDDLVPWPLSWRPGALPTWQVSQAPLTGTSECLGLGFSSESHGHLET